MKKGFLLTFLLIMLLPFAALFGENEADGYYGTLEAYAEENIYFVLTDRFVDGDSSNNYEDQGGDYPTWQQEISGSDGSANIGYMGGDFKGIYDNADYIRGMGFTALWVTPIVDNPDQNFSGGGICEYGSGPGNDRGKTGYHGYWADNFYQVDEHLPSAGLSFGDLCSNLENEYGMKIVLDIVCNHANPSFEMNGDQYNNSKFGKLYNEDWELVADTGNVKNGHPWFEGNDQLAQLADFDPENEEVMEYLVDANLKWIDQGASAFRIDTIKHMPMSFWKEFSDRIRAEHPDFYMFGEAFSSDASFLASFQKEENGGINVLDFPAKDSIRSVFGNPDADYSNIVHYLHLNDGTYTNPYDLVTFYDNHDMSRMDASDNGFIDAHNWLFTSRGIPCIYYGSEIGFQRGRGEHKGNRNYYGSTNISTAPDHAIYKSLKRIAEIRRDSPALQKGLQVNLSFSGQTAAFYRVFEHNGITQTALVLLNKGDSFKQFTIESYVSSGDWVDADNPNSIYTVSESDPSITWSVDPHSVEVLLFNDAVNHESFKNLLDILMQPVGDKVEVTPQELIAGQQATVTYRAMEGQDMLLHWGIDNWSGNGTPQGQLPMEWDAENFIYTVSLIIPAGATQFDFVFKNVTQNSWDTNGGADWHYEVADGPSYSVSGTVFDESGQGLENVTVSAGGKSTETDLYGNYQLRGLSDGQYTVSADKEAYAFTDEEILINGSDLSGINLTGIEVPVYTLSGYVSLNTQQGIYGALVSLNNGAQTTTDSLGYYEFSSLSEGTYTVSAQLSGYEMSPESTDITINSSDVANVDFEANEIPEKGITVHFKKPANWSNSTVKIHYWNTNSLEDPDTRWPGDPMSFEGDDWYSFTFKQATTVNVVFNNDSSPQTGNIFLQGVESGEYFYDNGWITGGKIEGRITRDGNGVGGVTLTANGQTATTDSDGLYSFTNMEAGSYELVPQKNGYTFAPAYRIVTVENQKTTVADFTAEGGPEGLIIHYAEFESAVSYSVHAWAGLEGNYVMEYEGHFTGSDGIARHWWKITLTEAPSDFMFCFVNSNGTWDGYNRSFESQAGEIYILPYDITINTERP